MFKFGFKNLFKKEATLEDNIQEVLSAKETLRKLYESRAEIMRQLTELNDLITQYEGCVKEMEEKTAKLIEEYNKQIAA